MRINFSVDGKLLKPEDFEIRRVSYKQSISGNCGFEVVALRLDYDTPFTEDDFVAKLGVVEIGIPQGQGKDIKKSFSGVINNLKVHYNPDGYEMVIFRVVPDFLANKTGYNRIFINKTTLDIVKEILAEVSKTAIKASLAGKYDPRECCLQYEESDWDFICRLLSEEGIAYYFDFDEKGKLTLHLTDNNKYEDSKVEFKRQQDIGINSSYAAQIGKFKAFEHDFNNPDNKKDVEKANADKTSIKQHTIGYYPYPAANSKSPGDSCLKLALEREAARSQNITLDIKNVPDVLNLDICQQFTYNRLERKGSPLTLVAIGMQFTFNPNNKDEWLDSVITAIDSKVIYRPELIPPAAVPYIPAIVVGPDKKQRNVDTKDGYPCVQIRPYWEPKDSKQTYWVRVAQPAAGKKMGTYLVPDVNSEVLVAFPYGPNRLPVVIGCLYDKSMQLPDLGAADPAFTMGFANKNEEAGKFNNSLLIDASKDKEKFYIEAAKDLSTTVHGGDHTEMLEKGNAALTLKEGNRAAAIEKGNDDLTISKGNRTTTVSEGNDTLTINKGNYTVESGGTCTITAKKEIVFKVGSATIIIDSSGKIAMNGTEIDIEGKSKAALAGAQVAVKGQAKAELTGAQVSIKGTATVAVEGAKTDIKGTAMATLKGAITMIG